MSLLIPASWTTTAVDAIASVLRGVTYKKEDSRPEHAEGLVPILRATNINHELNFDGLVYVPKKYVSDDQMLQSGDIVIAASSGSRSVVGKAAMLRNQWRGSFGAFCFALRPALGPVNPGYLGYFLQTSQYRNAVSELSAGVNINNLKRQHLEGMELPLAPIEEQARIVSAIETQFTRLDFAVETLRRIQANLKRYRASVLKAAVEGRLVPTEAELARQEGREYEPASVLLERILKARRAKWEQAELAKLKAKGTTPKNDKWKAKYKEPVEPKLNELLDVPEGWGWATVDQIAEVQGGLAKGKKRRAGDRLREVPYLRVANVQRGHLDLSEIKRIEATIDEIEQLRLQSGDVFFNEGGDRDKLGRGWVWGGEIDDCIHQNHVFRARILTSDVLPRFLSWYGNTAGQEYFFGEGKQTTNLASISLTKLRNLPVPLPPHAEQVRIVRAVEEDESRMMQGEHAMSVSVQRVMRLRQAILKWAFEGKLVDQDPSDEPASVLLARIKAERKATPAKKPPARRGRPKKKVTR